MTHRVAFSVVILTALVTATFTAAAVSFFSAVTVGAAASELTGRPGSAIGVTASASRGSIHQISAGIANKVRSMLPGLRPQLVSSPESNVLNLPGHAASSKLQTQLISLPGVAAHIVLVKGSCPATTSAPAAGGGANDVVPACVPATAARILGLSVGDQVTLSDSSTHAKVRVRITGTYSRAVPNSPYWMLDPMGSNAVRRTLGFTTARPLVTSPAVAASAGYAFSAVSMLAVPDFRLLKGTGLASLGSNLAARVSSLNSSNNFHDASITTGLPRADLPGHGARGRAHQDPGGNPHPARDRRRHARTRGQAARPARAHPRPR